MKHGYIRLSKRGKSQAEQTRMLVADGVAEGRLHVDDHRKPRRNRPATMDAREEAIHCIRPGDVLMVATAGRIGVSREDARGAIRRVAERGGRVQVAGSEPFGGPELAALLAFEEAVRREVEAERTAPARSAQRLRAPKKLTDAQRKALLPLWQDPDHVTVAAVEMKSEELGVQMKRRTLYKLLGVRSVDEADA